MTDEVSRDTVKLIILETLNAYDDKIDGKLEPRFKSLEESHVKIRENTSDVSRQITRLSEETSNGWAQSQKERSVIANDLVGANRLAAENAEKTETAIRLLAKRLDVVEEDRKDNKQQFILLKYLTICWISLTQTNKYFWKAIAGLATLTAIIRGLIGLAKFIELHHWLWAK